MPKMFKYGIFLFTKQSKAGGYLRLRQGAFRLNCQADVPYPGQGEDGVAIPFFGPRRR